MTSRVLVYIKQIYDPRLTLQVEGKTILVDDVLPEYGLDPASSAALEAALKLRMSGDVEVTALTLGPQGSDNVLRYAQARGVDRAIHLVLEEEDFLDPAYLAGCTLTEARLFDLVICGDGSFGPFLAEGLGVPQLTYLVDIQADFINGQLRGIRQLERSERQIVSCILPAVITVRVEAYPPCYVSILRMQESADQPMDRREIVHQAGEGTTVKIGEITLPRARPRRMSAAPSSAMSASQRISFLMGGSQSQPASKNTNLVEGTPDQVVKRVVEFLKERGFL